MWLLCATGCYAPQVPFGVACAPDSAGARCPAGQVCAVRAGREVCEAPGGLIDGGIDVPTDTTPGDWWDPAWSRRRPIDVTAGANGLPAGYSIAVTFDHLGLVSTGGSLASGDDVRIVEDGGGEVDRALDTGAAWSAAATQIWFRTGGALAPNVTRRYWLYAGNPVAGAPPGDPSRVFVIGDGFEDGLSAWNVDTSEGVARTTARAHRGSYAVVVPAQFETGVGVSANVDLKNVVIDAWWNIDDLTGADMSAHVRGNATSVYLTNLQPPGPTWDIAKVDHDVYAELIPPPPGAEVPPANSWFRVVLYAYEDQMAVDVDGARSVPATGFATVDQVTSGAVGLGGYIVANHVWFDDVIVRHFVLPEPAVTLGALETQ